MRVAFRNKGLIILYMTRAFSDIMISVWGMWVGIPLEYQGHLSSKWSEISALWDGYELEMALSHWYISGR